MAGYFGGTRTRYGVAFNVLVTVTRQSSKYPLAIYNFLKDEGGRFIQFNPVVERAPKVREQVIGLHFTTPPKLAFARKGALPLNDPDVTSHTVGRGDYGDVLIQIFDQSVRNDVGTIHVMNVEWALAAWLQLPATVCLFSERCGKAMMVEHTGDVYSCDHFMYPEYRLANLATDTPAALAGSAVQQAFGAAKQEACRPIASAVPICLPAMANARRTASWPRLTAKRHELPVPQLREVLRPYYPGHECDGADRRRRLVRLGHPGRFQRPADPQDLAQACCCKPA
ncbi:MAG: hypothetical protein V4508_05880 [Pseudomonadota bacterium]